jgi:hypothetical protein
VAARAPDTLTLKKHRDRVGDEWKPWARRGLLALLAVVPLLAAFNVFGQRPSTQTVETADAKLSLYAPTRLRGGLLYMGRFHVHANRDIKKAILILDPGWAESVTINTIEPSPIGEGSVNGRLSFELGHIPQGQSYVLYMEFQVNPTNIGHRSTDVELYDDKTKLLKLHRTVTIFP